MLCSFQGVLKVHGLAVHFALKQTHATAVFKIDCRNNDHESVGSDEAAKVRKNTQADFLALLGMKLAGEKRIRGDAGNKPAAIVSVGCDDRSILRHDIEGMDKVNK